ncbi:hypothetical protein [Lysobacter gummosus]
MPSSGPLISLKVPVPGPKVPHQPGAEASMACATRPRRSSPLGPGK